MKTPSLFVALVALPMSVLAADVTGTWNAEFDTQRGLQKYTFTLKQEGAKVTGKVNVDTDGQKRESDLKEGTIEGDTVTFVEPLSIQGNDIRITFTGKISESGIKFTRQVGDFGSSEATAIRDAASTPAQPAMNQPTTSPGARRGGGLSGPIELGPDDKPAYPEPQTGFNAKRDDIPHGEVKAVQYDSKSLGTHRQVRVYTPPGYSSDKKYPVLYLLHGIGGNDREWLQACHADNVIDNLLADGKIQPMILVFPNGNSSVTAEAGGTFTGESAGARGGGGRGGSGGRESWGMPFENDLLKDIIPLIEFQYSVHKDREHRALAGLSMGGGQTLNIGLAHPETFAFVGGFSSAPNTKPAAELVKDPAALKQFKLLWLACGNRDGLIRISQGLHSLLKEEDVSHVWNVDSHAHDNIEWANNLYLFAQHIFQ
jgi:enterochelin esterase-like enzyme